MTPLRQRMLADMQLRGLAPKTQESYLRAVRQLAAYYRCWSLAFEAQGLLAVLGFVTGLEPLQLSPIVGILIPHEPSVSCGA